MAEQESREKIADIIYHTGCSGACCECDYSKVSDADTYCKALLKADALLAAGLTFDKTMAVWAERENCKTLIQKAQYYDQMKHRAEVAELALLNVYLEGTLWCNLEIAKINRNIQLARAEKELEGEKK